MDTVGQVVAHALDEVLFAVKVPGNVTARVICPDSINHITISHEAMITLPLECSLNSDLFTIPKSHIQMTQTDTKTFDITTSHPKLQLFNKRKNIPDPDLEKTHDMIRENEIGLDILKNSTEDAAEKTDDMSSFIDTMTIAAPAIGGSITLVLSIALAITCCLLCKLRGAVRNTTGKEPAPCLCC